MQESRIDELKRDPQILRLVSERVHLKKENKEYVALCPFHQEKSGSLKFYQKDGVWLYKCFGCSLNGNSIQFIAEFDKIPIKEAIKKVEDALGDKWLEKAELVDATFRPVIEAKAYKTFPLSDWVAKEDALQNNRQALDWLMKERGITAETAKKLRFGFRKSVSSSADSEVTDGGWLAFPCIEGDKILSIKYRSLVKKLFTKQAGMVTALFNTETIDMFDPVLLVEGELDAAVLEQAGFRSVSLASASSSPTPEMRDQMKRAAYIVLAGDQDEVGRAVMDKLWRELGTGVYNLTWPNGTKDANQFFLETCKKDVSIFRTEVERLVATAKSQPMPDVYSVQEVMLSADGRSLLDHPQRFRFPWKSVDEMAVLTPGTLLEIHATQTGQGKSQFVIQSTLYGARKYNEVVLNYQCELTPEEIGTIITSHVLRKDRNNLTREDYKEAAHKIENIRYYVGHNPNLSTHEEVFDLIEAAVQRLGVTVLVLDTFHSITTSLTNEVAIQSIAAKRLKDICVKYRLKGIAIGQPKKANQQTKGKRTHITDIRGAGALPDNCDAVFALHRNVMKEEEGIRAKDTYESKTLVHAQKTRSKGIGDVETYLNFFGNWCTFEEMETRYEEPQATGRLV